MGQDVKEKYLAPDKVKVVPNDISLKEPVKGKKEYAEPHCLMHSQTGKPVTFINKTDYEFEILIHNKDRFFDTDIAILQYLIKAKEEVETHPLNKKLKEGDKKYYILYCVQTGEYSDGNHTSPPKIVSD